MGWRARLLPVVLALLPASAARAADLYIMSIGEGGSMVIDRGSVNRTGSTVRLRSFTYLGVPSQRDGREVRWVESQEEYDCEGHRSRRRVIGAHDHNAALIFLDANSTYRDWSPIAAQTPASITEAFVCRDQWAPGVSSLRSLAAFPAAALGKTAHRFYVNRRQDGEGWRVMALASVDGGGAIVSVSEMVLMPAPRTQDGVTYHWVEAQSEFDCAGHRRRDRGVSAFTLDRSRRRTSGNEDFRPWRPTPPGSPAREAEDFLCRNLAASSIAGFDDLTELQRAIAPGLR